MPRTKTNLTKREMMIFDYIREYRQRHQYSPTLREIMDGLCINSTSLVNYYLTNLEAAGKINRTPRIARSIVITETGQ